MSEVKFQTKWIERSLRDYFGLNEDAAITSELLGEIKYLFVTTTHSYEIGFGKGVLPKNFEFDDAGDEWGCCTVEDTAQFSSIEEFAKIRNWGDRFVLRLLKEDWKDTESDDMTEFNSTVKMYAPEDSDYEGLEEDEECNLGIISADDLKYFTNAEVVRLMSCETEIHSISFIKDMKNLRVLEIGEVRFADTEGFDKLLNLEKLCIWSN